jgi:uncharacterized RDD family membrane protein YckC
VDGRRVIGSWLEGPQAAGDRASGPAGDRYRGERLGLPERGGGSVAGFGARLLALCVDWAACLLVVRLLFPERAYGSAPYASATLAVFAVEVALLTWLGGASFGQRLRRLGVARLDGAPVGLWRALVRTALILVVVPALVTDRDGRGLHDRAAGTVVLRR